MNVNYELLRTFIEAARAPTFAKAAELRRVSPPAISQQISTLEQQLGVTLFQRIGKRIRLNEVGYSLLSLLEPHLQSIDQGLQELIATRDSVRGSITIGAPRPFGRFWLRPRVAALLETYRDLVVCMRFDGPTALRRSLLDGQCDLCVLVTDPNHAALQSEVIHVEEFVAVASRAYLAGAGTPASASDFRQLRYVVFDDDLPMHSEWWRAAFGRKEALPSRIVAKVASLDEMLALACAGVGVAVLPRYFVEQSIIAGDVQVLLPLGAKQEARARRARNAIYLAWRRDAVASPRFVATRDALLAKKSAHARSG